MVVEARLADAGAPDDHGDFFLDGLYLQLALVQDVSLYDLALAACFHIKYYS